MKNNIKILLLFIALLINSHLCKAQDFQLKDSIYIASWNVENLFDTIDDPFKNDSEFLPTSAKEWDFAKLDFKLHNLSQVINSMNHGNGPDIIGLQEVENIGVAKELVYKLIDRDYIVAHRESPDNRGIDASLIYDRNILDIVSIDTLLIKLPTNYSTRHILQVTLKHKQANVIIHVFVNHWPSRRGGEVKSEPNREAAASVLRKTVDSLFHIDRDDYIVILGDFNDEPSNIAVRKVLGANKYICDSTITIMDQLYNLAYKKHLEGKGTYLFDAKWSMLDQIIVSSNMIDGDIIKYKRDSFEIIKPGFMIIKSGQRKGAPLPTYSGSKYIGGFSDHYPVGAKFKIYEKGKL